MSSEPSSSSTPAPLPDPDGDPVRERLLELQGQIRDLFYRLVDERRQATGLGSNLKQTSLHIDLKIAPRQSMVPISPMRRCP